VNRTDFQFRQSIIQRLLLVSLCCLLLGLVVGSSRSASSADLAAVTLLYFRGVGQDNAVLLEWATGTEFDTAGFRVTRANEENGQYQVLAQIGFIPSEGDGLVGAEYEAVDSEDVTNGTVYWYKLVEIELNGHEIPAGPISVRAGAATPTATSSPVPTATPTTPSNGEQATSTAVSAQSNSTSTPTPANFANPQAGSSAATANPAGSTLVPAISATASTNDGTSSVSGASNNSNSVEAAAPAMTLDISGYPGPLVGQNTEAANTEISSGETANPSQPETSATTTPASYPASVGDRVPDLTPPSGSDPTSGLSVIGSQDSGSQESLDIADQSESERSGSSTLVLWLGFIASLLIFGAGVIGSIIYFSRHRMQGR
jgi:hypothetical protein